MTWFLVACAAVYVVVGLRFALKSVTPDGFAVVLLDSWTIRIATLVSTALAVLLVIVLLWPLIWRVQRE